VKVSDTLFVFGLVFIALPLIGLMTVFLEMFRAML
jgi:hypothetical protein